MTDKILKIKVLKAKVKLTKEIMKVIKEGLSVDDVKKILQIQSTKQSTANSQFKSSCI